MSNSNASNQLCISIPNAGYEYVISEKYNNPFEIRKPRFNKDTIQAIEDTKNGKNLSKTFDSVDEMFEELDK